MAVLMADKWVLAVSGRTQILDGATSAQSCWSILMTWQLAFYTSMCTISYPQLYSSFIFIPILFQVKFKVLASEHRTRKERGVTKNSQWSFITGVLDLDKWKGNSNMQWHGGNRMPIWRTDGNTSCRKARVMRDSGCKQHREKWKTDGKWKREWRGQWQIIGSVWAGDPHD